MTEYLQAKIKDRDHFKQVFPIPMDHDQCPAVGKFIMSIIGQTIRVRKLKSHRGTFYYVSDIDPRWVILPSWIQYFDTENLVPICSANEDCIGFVVYWDGTVVVLGR
jgi:hypothetical protein